jgi:hypothetical protein
MDTFNFLYIILPYVFLLVGIIILIFKKNKHYSIYTMLFSLTLLLLNLLYQKFALHQYKTVESNLKFLYITNNISNISILLFSLSFILFSISYTNKK